MINEIVVGRRYRFFSTSGRELKPRTVAYFNPMGKYDGGNVQTMTDGIRYRESMAGSYFKEHAREFDEPNPGATQ